MTTLPIHTVQHVKSVFKKYQLFAILFTTITIAAAFLTAISGFQLAKLRKMESTQTNTTAQPDQPASVPVSAGPGNDALEKRIKTLENQLTAEKTTSQELRIKIRELEKKIAAVQSTSPPQAQPVTPQTDGSAAAAPAAQTPAPVQPAAESKTVPALPKLTPPQAPAPVSEPSKPPVESEAPEKPSESPPPATTRPEAQPATPAVQKDQSLQAPAPATSPSASTSARPQAQPLNEESRPSSQDTGTEKPAKP